MGKVKNLSNSKRVIKRKKSLGSFEEDVLLAIAALRAPDGASGASIREQLEDNLNRSISVGALYATLDRLERKSLIRSWEGASTSVRGGRAKRYFKLERAAEDALKDAHRRQTRLHELAFGPA